MSYKEMIINLKQKENNIIFVKNGAFYIAIGNDAILLNKILDLKCTCFAKGICKVGVPIASIEKYSIGTEYKNSMYKMLEKIMYFNKDKTVAINTLNEIDVELNVQRIYLRIMYNNKWIDSKKFNVAMDKIYEIGKILGGLTKYYAKNSKKCMG